MKDIRLQSYLHYAFEKYADITVSEDGLELEETIENVMEVLENQ